MTVCLDSWAVLRWLEGAEPAASRVSAIIDDQPVMSWINLGEVFYVLARGVDEAAANTSVAALRPRLRLEAPNEMRVLEAARIKAHYALAYADAFAIATSIAHRATLWTGDPEILDAGAGWSVEDLRT